MNYVCFFVLFLLGQWSRAQSTLSFKLKQLPLLNVDSGKDTTLLQGNWVRLGGAIPASGGSGTYLYSWTPTAGLDSPAIARPVAKADTTITYTLTVDDGQGCKKTSQVKLIVTQITPLDTLSNDQMDTLLTEPVDTVESKVGLTIAPNPTYGQLFITTKEAIRDPHLLLQLYDAAGRMLFSQYIKGGRVLNEHFSLSFFAKGFYILKLTGTEFRRTVKLIFQ